MHLISCKGEYDCLQLWPVPCTITAQILRQAGQVKEYNDWKVKFSLNQIRGGYCLLVVVGLKYPETILVVDSMTMKIAILRSDVK